LLGDGRALPWVDQIAFARRAITLALADLASSDEQTGWVFFDRGLIDALAALQHLTGEPAIAATSQKQRFHRCVLFAPPWPEIHVTDTERRHSIGAAVAEYQRLLDLYPTLGYEVVILPKVSVSQPADFVLSRLMDVRGVEKLDRWRRRACLSSNIRGPAGRSHYLLVQCCRHPVHRTPR
jgi:predicted ATPase